MAFVGIRLSFEVKPGIDPIKICFVFAERTNGGEIENHRMRLNDLAKEETQI